MSSSDRNQAYSRAVYHSIEGLFTFSGAATILRIARALGELDASVVLPVPGEDPTILEEKEKILEEFFLQLDVVEQSLHNNSNNYFLPSYVPPSDHTPPPCYIVQVEGLDGSGKSSLVQCLAESLSSTGTVLAVTSATPTHSMAQVRPAFDRRGGAVARAYYMVSNYFLQYDIQDLIQQQQQQQQQLEKPGKPIVVCVDRWYASTVAYSMAWKNTTGGVESIDALEDSLFEWPRDLRRPDLLLLLKLDDSVRKQRVQERKLGDNFNPWDERLNQDENLGRRIQRALDKVGEKLSTTTIPTNPTAYSTNVTQRIHLDANQTQAKVLEDALDVVREHLLNDKRQQPLTYYGEKDPLAYFVWVSSQLGLCTSAGRRGKHAPWAIQVAWNSPLPQQSAPLHKTAGIHTVNSSGIMMFMRNHIPPSGTPASVIWCGGDYPYEQQWKGEGLLVPVPRSEWEILGMHPPPSLVAYTVACNQNMEGEELKTTAQRLRENPPSSELYDGVLGGIRFVPLRMEVLMGGPSSPGGPRRYEWTRNATTGWSQLRPILPFRSSEIPSYPLAHALKPVTVAFTGTHCAGKKTMCKLVAQAMGWSYQAELGELLRTDVVAGGHRVGDGSGSSNAKSWDQTVWEAEVARDRQEINVSRTVETWHVGNLAWALFRLKPEETSDASLRAQYLEQTKAAIQEEQSRRCVLVVHLSISPEDSLRRRHKEDQNSVRLPMKSEAEECTELHQALELTAQHHLSALQKDLGFPLFVVDNSDDTRVAGTAKRIVTFIEEHQWQRAF